MCGLEEDAFIIRVLVEVSLQREVPDGAMGVGEVVVAVIEVADGGGGLRVGDADGGEGLL